MGAVLPRERLAAILGMMGSEHDGECLAAARMAERMRREAGLSWQDIVCPAPAVRRSHTASEELGWRTVLAACLARPDRLTPWERQFCDQLATYRHRPSDKQLSVLAGCYCKAAAK